ncbi:MAG: hypothetical protein Q8L07_04240 [Sediminibacterium sp.]|nr:hypothetical protein [Sediminibacterium sp.]
MRKLFTILMPIIFLAGCVTQKTCSEKFPPSVITHDSIITETVINYHDTVIYVPGATVTENFYIRDTITRIDTVIRKNQASLAIRFHNGYLTAICKADSLQQLVNNLKSVVTRLNNRKNSEKIVQVPVDVIKYRIPKWMLVILAINALQVLFKLISCGIPGKIAGIFKLSKNLFK